MWKRISSLFFMAASTVTASAATAVVLGDASLAVPDGWTVVNRQPDRITLQSADKRQQTTFSLLNLAAVPSFEDFKRLCAQRLEGEQRELKDGFIEKQEPFQDSGTLGMFFSGGDKATGRVFSGFLSVRGKRLVTVYVEGLGTNPREHLATFKQFVTGLKRT